MTNATELLAKKMASLEEHKKKLQEELKAIESKESILKEVALELGISQNEKSTNRSSITEPHAKTRISEALITSSDEGHKPTIVATVKNFIDRYGDQPFTPGKIQIDMSNNGLSDIPERPRISTALIRLEKIGAVELVSQGKGKAPSQYRLKETAKQDNLDDLI